MTRQPAAPGEEGGRFPGFDSYAQRNHWDAATRELIEARVAGSTEVRFFTPGEFQTATALVGQLVDQNEDFSRGLCYTIDARLADMQTDGWHYDNMPRDDDAWRQSLDGLNQDAHGAFGRSFAELDFDERHGVLEPIPGLGAESWHGLPARRLWDLWMRYACTACYAHPSIWNEIGFPGPAYPRGYKNAGIGKREPFEVADVRPRHDPSVEAAP
jgi:hypothetical protein